jgi:hypothetical protein
MDVNKFIIRQNGVSDKQINIPIELKWDFAGQDQSIDKYQDDILKQVVGQGYDFEVDRFPHALDASGNTKINYEFYFYSGSSLSNSNSWSINYLNQGFIVNDLYYYNNNFTKSFFKLDFYDTVDNKRQTNYITIIIPTQQGGTMDVYLNRDLVKVKKPKFGLDYVGDKEGFFIYWLKNLDFLTINTFYMTAKFYNAKTGKFIKMVNKPQSTVNGDKFNFDSISYYYYRVVLDYVDKSYKIWDLDPIAISQRYGDETNPIKWYEYVNPPQ